MSLTVEQLAAEALSLPVAARVALVERLVQSLSFAGQDGDSERLWVNEVRERSEEVKSGKVQLTAAAEGFAIVRNRLAQWTSGFIPKLFRSLKRPRVTTKHANPAWNCSSLTVLKLQFKRS